MCQQLGFKEGALRSTADSYFGATLPKIWLDNIECHGHETEIGYCKNNGWGVHDCTRQEAAGVICKVPPEPTTEPPAEYDANDLANKVPLSLVFNSIEPVTLQITGGRNFQEGRVEILLKDSTKKALFCPEKWSLREATVICKQLGLSYAQQAVKTSVFGSQINEGDLIFTGVYCHGDEAVIDDCLAYSFDGPHTCESQTDFAGVVCNTDLPDLMPDLELIRDSVYLHDQPLFYLQCAMEENCLSSSAYTQVSQGDYYRNMRRLLRFSTRVFNIGTADFRPDAPKDNWEWHQCHMHHHSMETFSRYDIYDAANMKKVAEGHKASFCLEDSDCKVGVMKNYNCKNFGDQGISVGCWDSYLHDIDCQWIDITDVPAGQFKLKITVNPEFRVAETNYSNNAVLCDLYYNLIQVYATDCIYTRIN